MEKYFKCVKPLNLIPKGKKGMGIGDIYPALLMISLVAILIGVVLFVLDEFEDAIGNTSAAGNATGDIITEIADFVPWIGIILLVIAAAIVLGLLVRNLAGGQRV